MSEDNQENVVPEQKGSGSVERAIAGEFNFSIGDVLNESWEKTKGNKGTIWLAFLIFFVIYMITTYV